MSIKSKQLYRFPKLNKSFTRTTWNREQLIASRVKHAPLRIYFPLTWEDGQGKTCDESLTKPFTFYSWLLLISVSCKLLCFQIAKNFLKSSWLDKQPTCAAQASSNIATWHHQQNHNRDAQQRSLCPCRHRRCETTSQLFLWQRW
jgi:hypothetical protein